MSIILGINCLHADSSACIIKTENYYLQSKKRELLEKNIHQIYQSNLSNSVWRKLTQKKMKLLILL